jgi:hypothetical protein
MFQKHRFATPASPNNHHRFARLNGKVNSAQNFLFTEAFFEILDFYHERKPVMD